MRLPGRDHLTAVTPNANRVHLTFAGLLVADTNRALTLRGVVATGAMHSTRGRRYGAAPPHRP